MRLDADAALAAVPLREAEQLAATEVWEVLAQALYGRA
jgi:hypothetical protein